jgi:hypothetical protein
VVEEAAPQPVVLAALVVAVGYRLAPDAPTRVKGRMMSAKTGEHRGGLLVPRPGRDELPVGRRLLQPPLGVDGADGGERLGGDEDDAGPPRDDDVRG